MSDNQLVLVSADAQEMRCFENGILYRIYPVSTAKNGLGETMGSQCTPRGWHVIYSHIGMNAETNSVFVSREWTGELYSDELAAANPDRDWILTRILQLEGLEPGYNKGGDVDSLQRYIYIHGTPDSTDISTPGSHGCIRMRNADVVEFADWVLDGTRVHIE